MIHPLRHLKKKPISIFIVFLLLAGVFLLFSYISIDITAHKTVIKNHVEKNINATIDFDKAMVRLLPYPTITITNLAVYDESGDAIIRSASLKVAVSPLALIKKELDIKLLIIKDGVAMIKRYEDGSINLLRLKKNNKDTETVGFKPEKFKLTGGHFLFIDEKVKDGGFEVSRVKAYLNRTSRGYTFSLGGNLDKDSTFILSGAAVPEQTGQRISGTMDITNIEVATIKPYLHGAIAKVATEGTLGAKLDFSFTGANVERNNGTIKGSLSSKHLVLTPPYPVKKKLHSPGSSADLEMSWSPESFLFALNNIDFSVADPETHLRQVAIGGKIKLSATKAHDSGLIEADLHSSPVKAKYLKELIDMKGMPAGIRRPLMDIKEVEGKVAVRRLIVLTTLIPPAGAAKRVKKIALKLELQGTGITHKALKNKISGLSGHIHYNNGNLELLDIKGRYGRDALKSLNGAIYLKEEPVVKLSLLLELDAAGIIKELKASGKIPEKKYLKGKGPVGVKLSLNGIIPGMRAGGAKRKRPPRTKGLLIESRLDLTRTSFEFENALEKEMGFPVIINAKTRLNADGSLTGDAGIKAGKSTLYVKWKRNEKTGAAKLDIETKDLRIADTARLTPFIFSSAPAKGGISGHLGITKAAKNKPPEWNADIRVKDALFKTPILANTLRDFNLTLKLNGSTGRLILSDAKVKDSQLSARIEILDINEGLLDMNFVSKSFNTRDVFPPTYKPKVIKRQPFKGKGKFTVAKGRITNISYTNMYSEIELDHKDIILKPVTFTSHEGQVSGTILIKRERQNPVLFMTDFKVAMVELETLFAELGAKKKILSGRAMGECHLEMKRGFTPGSRGVDGFFQVSSQKGRMWKLIIFNKLFSIVNIISLNSLFDRGLIYDSVTGDFVIKGGVISTENLLLSSNSMRMSSIGEVDITENTINATLALHPFVTIDKIISKIPLAGWIITGKEKSTLTIYSEIKGPLGNPDVKAVPLKSIGRNIGGIFRRLLFIPEKRKTTGTNKNGQNEATGEK